jgi:polar amino acid transport system substrate-binding protein
MRRFAAILMLVLFACGSAHAADAPKETAFQRVMRTKTIRCGYAVWAPVMMKDANTGKFTGIYYDYMTMLGERLGMKIEWAVELDLSTYLDDLAAGKYDVECSGGWPNAQRGKVADYTRPIYYAPIYLYTAEGDTRFDKDMSLINDPKVRFVTMVGEQSEAYRRSAFPKSTEVSLPGNAMLDNILHQITYKKADVAFYDEMSIEAFMKANPGKLHRIPSAPVKVIPNNLSVTKGEDKLVTMLNTATEELLNEGAIDRMLDNYNLPRDGVLRIAKPYEVTK